MKANWYTKEREFGGCPSGPIHLRVNVNYTWPSYLLMRDPGLWVLGASQTTHNVLQQNLWKTFLFLSLRLLEGIFWHIQVIFSSKESHSSADCTVSLSNSFPEWSKMWPPQGQLIFTMGNKSKKFTVWVLLTPCYVPSCSGRTDEEAHVAGTLSKQVNTDPKFTGQPRTVKL